MRLTRERLLNLTNSYLTKIVRKDPNIICIYLTGSMLNEDPFIGGTTDVDLVIVHNHPRDIPRQIVPITEEATLDIHFFWSIYYLYAIAFLQIEIYIYFFYPHPSDILGA